MKQPTLARRSFFVAAIMVGALATTVPAVGKPGDDKARRVLSTAELRALLSKGALFRALPLDYVNATWSREYFFANGRYQGCGDRSMPTANYRVEGARLCLLLPGGKECRVLYRDASGQLHEDLSRGSPPAVWLSTPIAVTAIPAGESCMTAAKP